MELSRLPAKQKRYNDWLAFTNNELEDQKLREPTLALLAQFHAALARCFANSTVSDADAAEIADLERQLEQLNQEARMRVPGKSGSAAV